MGSQESDRSVCSVQRNEFTHGSVVVGIYNHRRDGFVSDEIFGYAEELTKGIDA